MSKKSKFIEFVQLLIDENSIDMNLVDPDANAYWEALISTKEIDKPELTDNGKIVLAYMQNNSDTTNWTAKAIAEGLGLPSRTPSGAFRKLCTDGFVEKIGTSPIVYKLTEKGKNYIIEN